MIIKLPIISYLSLLFALLTYGCFEEDTPIEPVYRNGIHLSKSMYHYQSFYDLSSDSILSSSNTRWDLAFETAAEGWRIRINYSNFLGIYRTASTNFNATSYPTIDRDWIYDASSGNPDSTAIGNWQNVDGEGPHIFLLGSYDGVRYNPFIKLRFISVTDSSYTFDFAKLDNSDMEQVTIKKDLAYNYVYYSFTKKDTVRIEPPKNKWDILFTQYTTTLFTNQGIPTPYIVRGIYLNNNHVASMLDSTTGYANITKATLNTAQLSTIQDFIGYNWKSVEINQSANTARYAVRKNYVFIIRDTEGDLYKLRFLSYVNDSLLVGYPFFEKKKLE